MIEEPFLEVLTGHPSRLSGYVWFEGPGLEKIRYHHINCIRNTSWLFIQELTLIGPTIISYLHKLYSLIQPGCTIKLESRNLSLSFLSLMGECKNAFAKNEIRSCFDKPPFFWKCSYFSSCTLTKKLLKREMINIILYLYSLTCMDLLSGSFRRALMNCCSE